MGGGVTSALRLEELTDIDDEQTAQAFAALANETRLAILLVLWNAIEPDQPPPDAPETTVSFSELYNRVEYGQTANFNYHLEKLTGPFVRKTDTGYTLTTSAERILSAVLAGTLTDTPEFEDAPIKAECMLCGTSTVVDYSDGVLTQRCPSCEGVVQEPDETTGVIAKQYRPPVGLKNRTPQEFVQHGQTWHRHRRHSFIEGVCPDCSGTVTTTIHVCDDHCTRDETVCGHCKRVHEIVAAFACDVCESSMRTGVWNTILTEVPVIVFFYEHGLDTKALEDELAYGVLFDAIEQVALKATEPLEIVVTVELDGDRLVVTLDDEVSVVNVIETTY